MESRSFIKMHGLGNDFVIVDARTEPFDLSDAAAQRIADRRQGIGCDQLIIMEPPANGQADVFMRIRNADGCEVGACGNATRCIAALLRKETGSDRIVIETKAGLLIAEAADGGLFTVDMGEAKTAWQDIPLAREMDTLHLRVAAGQLTDPVGVAIGNPHAVFFVDDAEAVDLSSLGPALEHNPLFPERANIGVATVMGSSRLRLRVWERGVGLTQACGTGACAAAVAAIRRGLTKRRVTVMLDGGDLIIEWRQSGHVFMTGPVSTSFCGTLNGALLSS